MTGPWLWVAALLAAAALHADDAALLSLHPIGAAGQSVSLAALEGVWASTGDGFNFIFRVASDGAGGYVVSYEAGAIYRFRVFEVGGETVADMTGVGAEMSELTTPLHVFGRVRLEGQLLRVDWIGKEALNHPLPGRKAPAFVRLQEDAAMLLTAPTAELRRFVQSCLARRDFPGSTDTYRRARPDELARELNEQSWVAVRGRADPAIYPSALAQARQAIALAPDNPDYWSTLGAACYRTGAWTEGLAAIARARELRGADAAAQPDDLVFTAMHQRRLGRVREAAVALAESCRLLAIRKYRTNDTLQQLLNEAEDLIEPEGK